MIGYNLINTSYRKKEALSTKSLLQFSSNPDFNLCGAFMEYKTRLKIMCRQQNQARVFFGRGLFIQTIKFLLRFSLTPFLHLRRHHRAQGYEHR